MASLNVVHLIGNLGRDPELRYTPNGTAVCTVSLASTNARNDKESGDRVEEAEWHRVVFYSRLAEVVGEYLKKGRSMYVQGRLHTRRWADKDGVEHFATEVIAAEMQMLGSRPDETGSSAMQHDAKLPPLPPISYVDDIPF